MASFTSGFCGRRGCTFFSYMLVRVVAHAHPSLCNACFEPALHNFAPMLPDAQRVTSRARDLLCILSPYEVALRVQSAVYGHARSELGAMEQPRALSAPPPRAPDMRRESAQSKQCCECNYRAWCGAQHVCARSEAIAGCAQDTALFRTRDHKRAMAAACARNHSSMILPQ